MQTRHLLPVIGIIGLSWTATCSASNLYGISFSGPTDLFDVDQNTGVVTSIGPSGHDNLGDLTSDTRPGSPHLWGVRIASNELFEFDPLTGAATSVATLNSPDNMVSIAFDPVSGKLYGNTSVGFGAPFDALYEIDPATGNSTFIGRILFQDVYALAFDQTGTLFGVSDFSNELISISTVTGNGSLIAGLSVGLSFDIASRPEDNVMFLADTETYNLYTVDTGTGALGLVGSYGSTVNVVGLAFLAAPIPEGSTFMAAGALGFLLLGVGWQRRRQRS